MTAGIYQIRNSITNQFYVGSSVNLAERKNNHIKKLRRNIHDNIHLQRAWNKYGENSFVFERLEILTASELESREQHYLDLWWDNSQRCYNIAKCAKSPRRGMQVTSATKEKMSKARTGKKYGPLSEMWRKNLSKSLTLAWTLGKFKATHTTSQVTKDKIGKANSKSICQLSVNGQFIKRWESATQAGRALGIGNSHIRGCVNGTRQTAGGFIWKSAF
jgi:group I intron endonuclease